MSCQRCNVISRDLIAKSTLTDGNEESAIEFVTNPSDMVLKRGYAEIPDCGKRKPLVNREQYEQGIR